MTDLDLLDAFDDAVVRSVASENGVDETRLRDALSDHQQTMRKTPGVENLVYEWRKQFEDPIVDRTPDRYVVAVRRAVWQEFAEYLDLDDYLLAAVSAVHQEQVLRSSEIDEHMLGTDRIPMIVVRE